MIAAIYARKSTEQTGVADVQKSVARQIEHAKEFARRKGWQVAEEHIYVDDGISGAEFANRPGFLQLMNALMPKPPFGVLVMSEESRLGREQIEVLYAMKQLVTAGVRVFLYLDDRERTLDSPIDKAMLALQTMADELEREKARQRTYDAMVRKAQAGHVTGGRVFGYHNRRTAAGYVERVINDAEAVVVRQIFELCASGCGQTRIVKQLNAEHRPAPRAQQGRPRAWAPSSLRAVLRNELYRGVIVWNRSRKRDRWGRHDQQPRPADEWMRIEAPALRVVSEELWQRTRERLEARRQQFDARANGAVQIRRQDVESRFLLSGFARCALCGGSFHSVSRSHGSRRASFYACSSYWKRGSSVCGNGLVMKTERIDDAVLQALGGDVLRPAVVMATVDRVLDQLHRFDGSRAHELDRLRSERTAVERELTRLTVAIAAGGSDLDPLLTAVRERQARRDELAAAIASMESIRVDYDRAAIEARVREEAARWRDLVTSEDVGDWRRLLRDVLEGPLRFTPEGKTYRFEGEAAMHRLLAGIVPLPPVGSSPTGFEPVFWP
jgi:DNA invertase Pin-like site-specific DNA recombinase